MMESIENYVQYLRSIVPYNNFKRLGQVFETDENCYFYDSGTGKVLQCEPEEYRVLECLTEEGTAESLKQLTMEEEKVVSALETVKQMIEQENIMKMPKYERFEPSDKEVIKQMVNSSLTQVTLEVTESCNLRCRYCIYQKGNEGFRDFSSSRMTWEIAKKAIDYAIEHSADRIAIAFYGGEPLINYDLIKQCIEYSRQFEDKKEIGYSFTSNLTLMTKERAEFFAALGNCYIMGSIDGPEEIHDKFRVTTDQKGSFHQAIQGLRNLVEAYGEEATKALSVNAVMTPPYSEEKYDKVTAFFRELPWFPNDIRVRCEYQDPFTYDSTFPEGIPQLFPSMENVGADNNSLDTWAVSHIIDSTQSKIHNTLVESMLIPIHHRRISNQPLKMMKRNACCIPAQRRLYVTTKGDFKVCERVGQSPYFGNVFQGIDYDLLYKHYIQEFQDNMAKHCSDCWCVHLCSKCYSLYCAKDKLDFEKSLSTCDVERMMIKSQLIYYHSIQERQRGWLLHLNDLQPV